MNITEYNVQIGQNVPKMLRQANYPCVQLASWRYLVPELEPINYAKIVDDLAKSNLTSWIRCFPPRALH